MVKCGYHYEIFDWLIESMIGYGYSVVQIEFIVLCFIMSIKHS